MSTPIQLSDSYLAGMVNNPEVRRAFPFFGNVLQNIKSTKNCSKCGASSAELAGHLQRVREYVINMPPENLQKLKNMLGVGNRQFVTYSGGRKNVRVVK